MEYISVKIKPEVSSEPHMNQLVLLTKRYGTFLGFYDGKHYRTSYAEILEDVTHYAKLSERPISK